MQVHVTYMYMYMTKKAGLEAGNKDLLSFSHTSLYKDCSDIRELHEQLILSWPIIHPKYVSTKIKVNTAISFGEKLFQSSKSYPKLGRIPHGEAVLYWPKINQCRWWKIVYISLCDVIFMAVCKHCVLLLNILGFSSTLTTDEHFALFEQFNF